MPSADSPSPDDAVAAARNWLSLVLDGEGDMGSAWRLATDNLRLCLVQTVIWTNRGGLPVDEDLDALASLLSAADPDHPHWPSMSRGLRTTLRRKWDGLPDLGQLPSLQPKPIDPTHELVILIHDAEGRRSIAHGESFVFSGLLMQRDDDVWLTAGFGERPPEPGWPPNYHEGPIVLR